MSPTPNLSLPSLLHAFCSTWGEMSPPKCRESHQISKHDTDVWISLYWLQRDPGTISSQSEKVQLDGMNLGAHINPTEIYKTVNTFNLAACPN